MQFPLVQFIFLSTFIKRFELFQAPRVFVINFKGEKLDKFINIHIVGLCIQQLVYFLLLTLDCDQLPIVAKFKKIVSGEIFSVIRNFLEIIRVEVIPVQTFQILYSVIIFLL